MSIKDLSKSKQLEIAKYLSFMITQCMAERKELDEVKIPEWWQRYRGDWSPKKDKSFPWKDSADFHVPFTTWACTSTESRILNAIHSADDIVLLKYTGSEITPEIEQIVADIQDYIRYELTKKIFIDKPIRDGTQRLVVEGVEIKKVVYEKTVKTLKKYVYNKTLKSYVADFIEQIIDGIKKIIPSKKIKVQQNDKIVEGNKIYIVPLKDFLWWGGDDVQECEGVAQRMYLNYREIMNKVKTDGWANIENLKLHKSKLNDGINPNLSVQELRESQGFSPVSELVFKYPLYEVWCYYDVDDDGYKENCKFVVEIGSQTLLDYDQNSDFWGDRPFITTPLHSIAGSVIGQGLPERLAQPNDELDILHDQIIDNATKINTTIATVIPNMVHTKTDGLKLKPNTMLPVSNHDALKIIDLGTRPLTLGYQEAFIKDILERLAIITDYSLGREANIERPTASGKAMALQEYSVNFDIILRNVRIGLKEMIVKLLKNLYQYMPNEGIEYPVLNQNDDYAKTQEGKLFTRVLTRRHLEIIDDLVVEVGASAINAVKGLQQQNAFMLYDKLASDNTGEINTHALKEYLVKAVDRRVVSRLVRDPQEIMALREQFQKLDKMLVEVEQKAQELGLREQDVLAKEKILNGEPVVPDQSNLPSGEREGGGI